MSFLLALTNLQKKRTWDWPKEYNNFPRFPQPIITKENCFGEFSSGINISNDPENSETHQIFNHVSCGNGGSKIFPKPRFHGLHILHIFIYILHILKCSY